MPENEKHNHQIKFVCRLENQIYQQEVYLDNILYTEPEALNQDVQCAMRFWNAFAPEQHIRKLAQQQENAVLVFRTTTKEMQRCYAVFEENSISLYE